MNKKNAKLQKKTEIYDKKMDKNPFIKRSKMI